MRWAMASAAFAAAFGLLVACSSFDDAAEGPTAGDASTRPTGEGDAAPSDGGACRTLLPEFIQEVPSTFGVACGLDRINVPDAGPALLVPMGTAGPFRGLLQVSGCLKVDFGAAVTSRVFVTGRATDAGCGFACENACDQPVPLLVFTEEDGGIVQRGEPTFDGLERRATDLGTPNGSVLLCRRGNGRRALEIYGIEGACPR